MADEKEITKIQAAFDELQSVNRLIERICQVHETNHIMSIIINELVRLTEADEGVISLVSPLTDESLETVVRKQQAEERAIPYKVGSQITGWVLKEKRILKIDDLDTDRRFSGLSSEGGKYQSLICCPMITRGEVVGLTSLVRSNESGTFTDDQARVAGIIASQSAQILSNALLLKELADKNELLELSQQKLKEENIRLRGEISDAFAFENIVGKSELMKKVLTLASKASTNEAPVLILGDTGTGKELVARAIHYNSTRKDKPLVIKNCGVKTESLLESELFGHIKGAFTGADRTKPGLFKEADGGTIFLDEIGDAPVSTQAAILRVLENGEIRPVGASKTEYVNVRIISATNKNLSELIKDGDFRQDLYYRLNTFTIELPPLTQRPDDIPLLIYYFLKKLRIKLANDRLAIAPAAMDFLCQCAWPGNVRQLENELERAAVVCDTEGIIDVADLSPELLRSSSETSDTKFYRGQLREITEKVERDVISAALIENRGNILKTSKVLGLTRKGLKDKMTRYGISAEDSK
ncbi:MAG: sigma 54-interacting transcriptional regulator [Candidatus Zixiibacteriota bacterium]|nr:MAG: sigma 54-interacting transcriptional regulator [candidate division Zixibacteria bacterium]